MADSTEGSGELLTMAELARHYGVTIQRVSQWVKAGLPVDPASPIDPRTGQPARKLFRLAAVDAWRATATARQDAARRKPRGGRRTTPIKPP
jgi:hypothetical protein